MFAAVSAAVQGRVAYAVYTGAVGLLVLLAGLRMSAPPHQDDGQA
jgi:hypothetical protein